MDGRMRALSEVQRLLNELVNALERAKSEAPDIAIEPLTYFRAEAKVLRRRLDNLVKALGAKSRPAS